MELRHIRYFLAVAEELNFTRAAARLHIAQPPLTQQIKALEAEMGVKLFDRSRYRIELTAAGRVFMSDAVKILENVRAAVVLAQRAARGSVGQVRVGFTESATFNPLVTTAFANFRLRYPDVTLSLDEQTSVELSRALRDGQIDVAFVRPPLRNAQGLDLHLLQKEPMVVAVPALHPLARRARVALAELAHDTFVLYPRSVRPGLADAVIEACEQAGFTPRIAQFAPQLSSTINLVAATLGISIVPQSMQGLQSKAVAFIEIEHTPLHALLGVAHRSDERSPAVLEFVKQARRTRVSQRRRRTGTGLSK